MKYSRPEVTLLGDAARFIQNQQHIKTGTAVEQSSGQYVALSPAYDLDE